MLPNPTINTIKSLMFTMPSYNQRGETDMLQKRYNKAYIKEIHSLFLIPYHTTITGQQALCWWHNSINKYESMYIVMHTVKRLSNCRRYTSVFTILYQILNTVNILIYKLPSLSNYTYIGESSNNIT